MIKENFKYAKKCISEELKNIKNRTACATGHRPQKLPWGFNEEDEACIKVKTQTREAVLYAINCGYKYFISGMALGFDIIFAEIVLSLKQQYDIELICAVPCKTQSRSWNEEQKTRYQKIIKSANKVRCIFDTYTRWCMHERNKYMVENSSLIIALYDGSSGGTKNTVELAKKKGLQVIEIKP